jgi:hypothetical protein
MSAGMSCGHGTLFPTGTGVWISFHAAGLLFLGAGLGGGASSVEHAHTPTAKSHLHEPRMGE